MPLPRPTFRPYVIRRRPDHLPLELGHLAEHLERTMYCTRDLRWQPQEQANLLEPEILAERQWLFQTDHWALEDEAFACISTTGPVLAGNVYVRVFHADVDRFSRTCQHCGRVVWDPTDWRRLSEATAGHVRESLAQA